VFNNQMRVGFVRRMMIKQVKSVMMT